MKFQVKSCVEKCSLETHDVILAFATPGVTIWELCTFGDRPYRDIGDFKAIPNYLKQGHRLKRPFICSPEFYSLLFQCKIMKWFNLFSTLLIVLCRKNCTNMIADFLIKVFTWKIILLTKFFFCEGWNIEPETRPSFEELVIQLQHMKTQPSRYINVNMIYTFKHHFNEYY